MVIPNRTPFLPAKREALGPGARVDSELSFVFNDKVDPNHNYLRDTVRHVATQIVLLGQPTSYNLSIGWRSPCSVWLPIGGGRQVTGGYPSL